MFTKLTLADMAKLNEQQAERTKELEAELADYHDAEKFVADPPHDQECCGCVALLRKQIKELEAIIEEAISQHHRVAPNTIMDRVQQKYEALKGLNDGKEILP